VGERREAAVVHGPWTGPVVEQPAPRSRGQWWRRDDHGRLWVWCSPDPDDRTHQWHPAPVPLAKVTKGIPDRSPNRDRITAALDLRAMHGPEVDEALGVADVFDTVVDSWEAGEAVPTEDDVRRLATLTGMLPEWFYAGTLPQAEGAIVCGRGGCRRVTDG
jgi:hypothetical protein